ncbi:MAG: general stress protein [Jatrophihabitans sp.]
MTRSQMFTAARMELEYPMSLGVYERYVTAQHAVDHLADQGFPVQNLEIVGTELRSIERVTGRLTRGKIAAAGALSGLWIGLFVGIAFSLFSDRNQLGFLVTTPLLGAVFGLAWSQLGYSTATRHGTRDFASVNQVVATKYEVLVEHKHAARAREILAAMPREVTI